MKKKILGIMGVVGLLFAGCSSEDDILSSFHNDPNAVRITAEVGKASANGFTRSNLLGATEADQKKFNENDEISVQADGQDAVTYKLVGSEWQPQDGKFLKWESNEMNFTAYYPATFDGNLNNITLPAEYDEASLAANDFMSYSGKQSNNKGNQLTLTMERKMARVVVEIAGFNDQYTTNATVNSLSICGIKAYKHDNKFYALIKPCEAQNSETFISLDVAEGENKTTTETLTGIPALTAGNSYTYQLKVGKNKISVSGITVANWTSGEITGGKAEEIIPYVTFKAKAEQKFKMITYGDYSISRLEYSVNNGKWQNVEKDIPVTFGGTNGTLRLRGTNINGTASLWDAFSTITFTDLNVKVACTGDIRTLLDWRNYSTVNTQNARFCNLFQDCAVLTSAPELPAKELADNCYSGMFSGCTSLTAAPELKATTLARSCYSSMFSRCTSLEKAPELKATTLVAKCYFCMFSGCTSLEKAPELKATTLVESCYESMFNGCTSLEKAPELKATTLVESCYESMFNGCTKLTSVTMLAPSDQISQATYCCYNWLYNAGTDETVTSRTLIVTDEAAYNALVNNTAYLPAIWKKDQCTVEYYTPKP